MNELEKLLKTMEGKMSPKRYQIFIREVKEMAEIHARPYFTGGTSSHEEREGEAYSFFRSEDTFEKIKKAIPEIRDIANTPRELELSLMRYEEISDNQLKRIGKIKDSGEGQDYVFHGKMKSASNKQVADHLGTFMTKWMDDNESSGVLEVSYIHSLGWTYIKIGKRWVNSSDIH